MLPWTVASRPAVSETDWPPVTLEAWIRMSLLAVPMTVVCAVTVDGSTVRSPPLACMVTEPLGELTVELVIVIERPAMSVTELVPVTVELVWITMSVEAVAFAWSPPVSVPVVSVTAPPLAFNAAIALLEATDEFVTVTAPAAVSVAPVIPETLEPPSTEMLVALAVARPVKVVCAVAVASVIVRSPPLAVSAIEPADEVIEVGSVVVPEICCRPPAMSETD